MPTKTHLEFRDARSSKFWEIAVDGNRHTVRFGKIGTEGRSVTKTFKTPDLAQADATGLTRSKLKKGYAASGGARAAATASPKENSVDAAAGRARPSSMATTMKALVDELVARRHAAATTSTMDRMDGMMGPMSCW